MVNEYINHVSKLFKPGSRIIVAMSGGVDSSVSAALIKRAGFEVIGITLQLYRSEGVSKGKTCCAGVDIQDASQVAEQEGFKHYVLDYAKIFKEKVIDDFVNTYESGSTPIPCGRCNQFIKFGDLLDFCQTLDADYLVTGHYIDKKNIGDDFEVFRSKDLTKDQSYFLALTSKKQFGILNFPLAGIEKDIVKKLALELELKVAKKPESQDICFIPDGDYKGFLKKLRPEMFQVGNIFSKEGKELGVHEGLAAYTVGQRKGLNLNDGPWYVLKLDTDSNSLIVGKLEDLDVQSFKVQEINLLVEPDFFKNKEILIQVRARNKAVEGVFDYEKKEVRFMVPQSGIAPGQICAFYEDDKLLGGGIIKEQV